LREAFDTALHLQRDVWDFAVEIRELRDAGLSDTDLRWLICSGYVEHGIETVKPKGKGRSFRCLTNPALTPETCFVLTARGLQLSEGDCGKNGASNGSTARGYATRGRKEAPVPQPRWDNRLRRLLYDGHLVKHFREPAQNQETVLAAFEEEGWPPRIDDPLPQSAGIDPKRRLKDTIKRLNRNQIRALLRFRSDGRGTGISWEQL
jgi:hypothetical protein